MIILIFRVLIAKDIIIAQGKNPGKGGLEQPLDSVNNALIIDKNEWSYSCDPAHLSKHLQLMRVIFLRLTGEANKSLSK